MHIPGTLWQELVITLCLLRHSFLKSILPRPQSSQSKGEAQLLFFLCCKWNDDPHTHEPLVIQLCPPYWKAVSWRKGCCPHDKTPSKRCAVHAQAQELLWERTHFPHLHYCSQYPETKWHLGKSSTDPEPETSEVVPEFSVPQELRFVLLFVTRQILSANSEPDPGVGGWGGAVSVLEWRKEASGSWQSVPQRWPLAPCHPGHWWAAVWTSEPERGAPAPAMPSHQAPDSLLCSIWTSAFEICFENVKDIGLFWLGKFYQGFSIGTRQVVPMPDIRGKAAWGPCFREQISRMFNLIRMDLWLLPGSLNPGQVNADDICSSWCYLKWVWKGHWLTSKLPPPLQVIFPASYLVWLKEGKAPI